MSQEEVKGAVGSCVEIKSHSCDYFIYPLYNDLLQVTWIHRKARQFAWVSDCLSLTSDSKIYTTEKSGADPSKKSKKTAEHKSKN